MIQPNILPKYNDTISAIIKILPIPIYYDTPNDTTDAIPKLRFTTYIMIISYKKNDDTANAIHYATIPIYYDTLNKKTHANQTAIKCSSNYNPNKYCRYPANLLQ